MFKAFNDCSLQTMNQNVGKNIVQRRKTGVEDGQLQLGTWQGIYFCEYDGPRHRSVLVKVIG